jgi:peptide/nickel transport system substrate-binding protein
MLILNHGIQLVCKAGEPAWGCAGKPDGTTVPTQPSTQSLKVREAIQAALDLDVINERVNEGKGRPSTSLLDETFPWNPDVPMPETNTARAKTLADEAKAAGWNGTVRLNCGTESPERRNLVIAVEALLGQAGITLDKSDANVTVAEQTANVIVNKDFEMSCWGLQLSPDDDSTRQIEQFLRTGNAGNRGAYANPQMDVALSDLKTASTDDERTEAWRSITELWNEDMIGVSLFATPQGTFWNADVHGIQPTGLSAVLLDKTWIG